MGSPVKLHHGSDLVSPTNPLPVTPLPPTSATAGTAAAIAAVDAAPDLAEAWAYHDVGTADQRLDTITRSSALVGRSYVVTYLWAGSPGAYRYAGSTKATS